MGEANGGRARGPRCIAIVGPFASGKTTLLEAILARTGTIQRQGSIAAGNTVGDASPEARAQRMSVALNIATADFMGDAYTFLDCPGSVEFMHDMRLALGAVDAAVVVTEADEKKVPALQLILKELEDRGIPRFLFVNKIDKAEQRLRDTLAMLQPASRAPLVLRQIPIWRNDIVTGFIDLALERAFVYREHAPSEVVEIPDDERAREVEARYSMLEKLADYDDALMEQLLEDLQPPRDLVFDDLSRDLREGLIVPVLIGAAERGHGVTRLLKALRHEAPGVETTAGRLGLAATGQPVVHVLKTIHAGHGGKLSIARVLSGEVADGTTLTRPDGSEARVSGVYRLLGEQTHKLDRARAGDTVALGRLETVRTGETLTTGRTPALPLEVPRPPQPVMTFAVVAKDRKDEVKLTAAVQKLIEEDPSLALTQDAELHELRLAGQGEMHLRVALAKLTGKYGVPVTSAKPKVGYRETIRKPTTQRGRHKKQSGGHGQFGDVVVDIAPLPRGSGFAFNETITGGVVPRNYIPAVEAGVREALQHGPLGFPVVDLAVTLKDGSYHSVDSSDQAFKMAGRLAMTEGLPNCQPVLLEPILKVEIATPSDTTARINAIISGRRGQILGFDARPGWPGWDLVEAYIPESEMQNLIIEIRSATAGVGSFTARFDHMTELTGRLADQVAAAAAAPAA